MAATDVKHGLTEKEYADEVAHDGAAQTATDQYVSFPSGLSREDPPLMMSPRYGQPLFRFDPEAERKLRRKIDMMIVPTVALLYLFCFIDR